jgi:hypothetical protein
MPSLLADNVYFTKSLSINPDVAAGSSAGSVVDCTGFSRACFLMKAHKLDTGPDTWFITSSTGSAGSFSAVDGASILMSGSTAGSAMYSIDMAVDASKPYLKSNFYHPDAATVADCVILYNPNGITPKTQSGLKNSVTI